MSKQITDTALAEYIGRDTYSKLTKTDKAGLMVIIGSLAFDGRVNPNRLLDTIYKYRRGYDVRPR